MAASNCQPTQTRPYLTSFELLGQDLFFSTLPPLTPKRNQRGLRKNICSKFSWHYSFCGSLRRGITQPFLGRIRQQLPFVYRRKFWELAFRETAQRQAQELFRACCVFAPRSGEAYSSQHQGRFEFSCSLSKRAHAHLGD